MVKRISFVCVENAGRSQIAEAVARSIVNDRDLDVEISSGGTNPKEEVHDLVKEVLDEKDILRKDMEPKEISLKELRNFDHVITMGCDVEGGCPALWDLEVIEWNIPDPKDKDKEEVIKITSMIEEKVRELLEKI